MWEIIGKILTGPIIGGVLAAYQKKLDAGIAENTLSSQLAQRELLVQQRELEVQSAEKISLMGHPLAVENLFAYVVLIYFAKAMVWDKVLGPLTHGSTDPVGGAVAVWAGMIITYYFGKRGVTTALQFWASRKR